jgi:ATP-dependent RNA helicase DDX55/SPB4
LIVLKELEVLVLDEADTLLDMGFRQSINQVRSLLSRPPTPISPSSQILSMLPKQRRTGLFSATQTQELRELAVAGMRNPVTIAVTIKSAAQSSDQGILTPLPLPPSLLPDGSGIAPSVRNIPTTLHSYFAIAPYDKRLELLTQFLWKYSQQKIIVFVSTCSCVDYYTMALNRLKAYQAAAIATAVSANQAPPQLLLPANVFITGLHGKMVPKKRSLLYQKFVSCDHSNTAVMFCTDVAARGIDIPDVDWIIQLTAPKDPSFFIHRIGRTARAGKEGNALIFVTEEERSYVELLRGRGVPMNEMEWLENSDPAAPTEQDPSSTSPSPLLTTIRTIASGDRDLLEAGSTAFISFIRAYKENLCTYIFRMDQLAIGDVARSYSLLKLPKIAETVKFKHRIQFEEAHDVDTSAIPYPHREKEAARQRKLQTLKSKGNGQTGEQQGGTTVGAAGVAGKKGRDKEGSSLKKKAEELETNQRKRKKKEGMHSKIMNEWEELAAEETIFKKFRRGKITQETYEDALTGDDVLEIDDVIALGNQKKRKIHHSDSDGEGDSSDEERVSEKPSFRELKQSKVLEKQKKAEARAKRFVGAVRQPKKQEHFSHRKQKDGSGGAPSVGSAAGKQGQRGGSKRNK